MSVDPQAQALGLVDPYVSSTGAPSGAVSGNSDPVPFDDAPQGPAYAATEDDVAKALANPTQPLPAPAGFLNPVAPAQASQPQAQPAPVVNPQTGQIDPSFWESDSNPYKAQARQNTPDPIREIDAQLQSLPVHAQSAYNALIAQGMDANLARTYVDSAAAQAQANLLVQRTQTVAAPAVRTQVAGIIAQKFSLPGSPIDPKELANESTPAAMEALAKGIQAGRRNSQVQTRVASRVDAAENSGGVASGSAGAVRNLTPFEMIRQGVQAGSRRR